MAIYQEIIIGLSSLIIVCINSLYIGYCLGKKHATIITHHDQAPQSFFKKNTSSKNNNDNSIKSIDIDESKVVVALDTNDLEKKYEKLGETKKSHENISGSIDKLKNLKK